MIPKFCQAPLAAWGRHRIQCDGQGVATLVCFYGCPLRCKYCINPFTWAKDTPCRNITPQEIYEMVRVDELYFLATGGGVTFGGGEPLLYPGFIQKFREICGPQWHICAETSLNVPWKNISRVLDAVDVFYIDCKDTNSDIYRRYTGKDNARMLKNLRKLAQLIPPERILVRLPLIPGYNTDDDRKRSKALLEEMGIAHFDLFEYMLPTPAE